MHYANTPIQIKEFNVKTLQSKLVYSNWGFLGSYFCPKIQFQQHTITTVEFGDGRCKMVKNSFDTVTKDEHYVYVGILDFDISNQVNKYNASLTVANGITTKDFLTVLYIDGVMTMSELYRLLLDNVVLFRIMSSSEIQDVEIGMDYIIFT
jgi:hypothetical protein